MCSTEIFMTWLMIGTTEAFPPRENQSGTEKFYSSWNLALLGYATLNVQFIEARS